MRRTWPLLTPLEWLPASSCCASNSPPPTLVAPCGSYDATAAYLRANPPGPAELAKAVIGAVGELDSPQSVDGKSFASMVRWLSGVGEADRQAWRTQVLGTTAADFAAFADRLDAVAQRGAVAVVGSERALAEANEARAPAERMRVRKVLE